MGTPAQAEERALRINRIEHLLRVRCSFCGALAGELCRTEAGREILSIGSMHLARITPTRVHERFRRYRWSRWARSDVVRVFCAKAWERSETAHVRFGSQADIAARLRNVRFTPESGH